MINTNMNQPVLGLYIHIPFCNQICSYCDFYKLVNLKYKKSFVLALCNDIKSHSHEFSHIETLYFGGGTPSILNKEEWLSIINALNESGLNFNQLKEFSIEANPNDINEDYVALLAEIGVTRVSLGIQSLDSTKLKLMNRSHTVEQALNAIRLLKNKNIHVNTDLIYGFGNDTFKKLSSDLDACILAGTDSFSLYTLILEEHTHLYQEYQKHNFTILDDEKEKALYYQLHDYLEKHHYNQYEVSNYAKPGYESLHNLLYWHYEHFLGLGPSAASFIDHNRFTMKKNIIKYCHQEWEYEENIVLTPQDEMIEFVMMGLRLVQGIDILVFKKRFNREILDVFPKISKHLSQGTLCFNEKKLAIPFKYFYVQNTILEDILF